MKKLLATLLCAAMVASLSFGVFASEDPFADLPEAIDYGVTIKATPEMYPDIDLSKHETIYIYLIGDTPNDFGDVLAKVNEYLEPFNTDLEFTIMAWSDYSDLYSLALTAGEDIDMIFTAPWCYLWVEANKGSFLTLEDEFIDKYMPLTRKYQLPASWDGVKLAGNIIAVPQNTTNPNGKIVAIRKDLADKYEIGDLTSWEDYKNYVLTIAEKETPESGILGMAAAGNNAELWDVYREQFDTLEALRSGSYITYYFSYTGGLPTFDEIQFAWTSQWFSDFCKDMKEMADAGVWSRSALTNEVSDDDAFGALSGASIAWNTSVFTYIEQAEKTEGVECAAYDITMNIAPGEAYNNNDMAITTSSKDPERTAMVLDIIKNDTYVNHLFRLGIEGVHYSIDENGVYEELEKSADFAADNLSMCWAIKNGDLKREGADPRRQAIEDAETEKMVANPLEGFVFDDSNVSFEKEAVDAIFAEYIPSLELGLFDDPDAKIAEMMEQAEAAGFSIVEEEFKAQYEAWYAAMSE